MYIKLKTLLFEDATEPTYELPPDVQGDPLEQARRLAEAIQDVTGIMYGELEALQKAGRLDEPEINQYDMYSWILSNERIARQVLEDLTHWEDPKARRKVFGQGVTGMTEERLETDINEYVGAAWDTAKSFEAVEKRHGKKYVPRHYKLLIEYLRELRKVLNVLFTRVKPEEGAV